MMRTFVVTGATDGIGRAVVSMLIAQGHRVIGVARNPTKAERIAAEIGSERLSFVYADLSSSSEVAKAAAAIRDAVEARPGCVLDGVIHVAGVVATHRETTVDGYERTFAVNHLAVHHLTTALLPLLADHHGARVIVVSSRAHRVGFIHFRDVMWKHGYWLLTAYAQSKLANVLFVRSMARRIDPVSVSFYAIDPGLVDTGIVAKTTAGIERWIWSWRRRAGTRPEVPAEEIVRIATDPVFALRSGLFWRHGVPIRPACRSGNVRTMERLYELSEALIAAALDRSADEASHR
jgi:NAD(P)-dependent dehydrogenase (short-subunit alcohol dehydrogenase family)